tara:strand:+ start:402 stop:515 length:114 start_codon:yes stop_codon:yes gene_type:complete
MKAIEMLEPEIHTEFSYFFYEDEEEGLEDFIKRITKE